MSEGSDLPPPVQTGEPNQERPTLKTIAAATGLAIATVSRALKDAPDIGEETKRRVREVAKTLGYRPNRAGVRLRTGKTNVIALVLSSEEDVMNHTSRLIYSVAAALRGTAYHLVVMPYFPDQDPMDPIRYIVETESADGVLLNQTHPDDRRVRYMSEHAFPFATHGRTEMDISHPYFDYDNNLFAQKAVGMLAARGRRRLMLVQPPRVQTYSGHMVAGFTAACAAAGLEATLLRDATSDSPISAISAAIGTQISETAAPDGYVCGSTSGAIGAVIAAEACGLVVGRDFDTVAKEAFPFLQYFRGEILVLCEDVGRAGTFLAKAVMAAIERRAPEQSQFIDTP